jgi:hypothetical protein
MRLLRKLPCLICFTLALFGLGSRLYLNFSTVSNYPFAITWSESGNIYNAYKIYASIISSTHSSWPWLDPARSILDGLILLIPESQLWMWRFWIAILYLISTFATSFLIVKKSLASPGNNNRENKVFCWMLTIWGVLFLFQGPIYYHLLVGIIPVLWLYKHNHPIRTIAIIAISAVWTGLTRVNWFLMPAMVASVIYILKESKGTRTIFQYIKWPIRWGIVNSIISGGIYLWSVHLAAKPTFFDRAMEYGFFRSKLWPNDGFPLGLIPGIFLISSPAVILILSSFWNHRKELHWVRVALIASLLAILGAGSTLVSLRSGGGYDLHNYDTLLLSLFLISIILGSSDVILDKVTPNRQPILLDYRKIAALLLIPILFTGLMLKPRPNMNTNASNQAINKINLAIDRQINDKNNLVLFIDQRHLLVYHLVTLVEIFSPYEKIELMEMAMATNQKYLDQFWEDMEYQKFDLIVSSVLWEGPQRPGENPYWYENNVWSNNIVFPIQRYYQPIYVNNDVDLAIYVPKEEISQ